MRYPYKLIILLPLNAKKDISDILKVVLHHIEFNETNLDVDLVSTTTGVITSSLISLPLTEEMYNRLQDKKNLFSSNINYYIIDARINVLIETNVKKLVLNVPYDFWDILSDEKLKKENEKKIDRN